MSETSTDPFEDLGEAFAEIGRTITEAFTPVFENLVATFEEINVALSELCASIFDFHLDIEMLTPEEQAIRWFGITEVDIRWIQEDRFVRTHGWRTLDLEEGEWISSREYKQRRSGS